MPFQLVRPTGDREPPVPFVIRGRAAVECESPGATSTSPTASHRLAAGDALTIYGTRGRSRSSGSRDYRCARNGSIGVALFSLLADAPFNFRTPQHVAHRARPPPAPKHDERKCEARQPIGAVPDVCEGTRLIELKERRLDSPAVRVGQEMQQVAREKSGPDTKSILEYRRHVAIHRRPVEQSPEIQPGSQPQGDRAPKLPIDLD